MKNGQRYTPCPFIEKPGLELLLEVCQSLLELIHASACVNELLLAREEGVALGADINSEIAALGGLGFNNFAACAFDLAHFVIRMDSVFHLHVPLFQNLMFLDIGESRHA